MERGRGPLQSAGMNLESAGQAAVSEAELRLLGPLEVVLDGRLIDVGHARQLVVLAALAVEVNQPTPPDRLVDRVWGNRPPQRAREALQSYLSRLRKALRPTGMVIAHRPTGYVLEAEPMAVDLHRFRSLVERAGSVEDAEAYPLLDQAQALWRGPVLETADTPWADQVRHALEGERFAAQLRRTDVGLRLGLHADLVAVLVAAGEEHPWDERLAAQTMLAFYRCGRASEALECYRGFRARLADELGSEPGATLRALHQRMLEADPMLDLTAPRIEVTSPDAPRVVPRQLLAAATTFAGRTAELAELTSLMAAESPDQPTIVAISAGGGMGKTWLAREWADRHASGYPDGQLYVDLHGFDPVSEPTTAAAALRWFLNALDVHGGRRTGRGRRPGCAVPDPARRSPDAGRPRQRAGLQHRGSAAARRRRVLGPGHQPSAVDRAGGHPWSAHPDPRRDARRSGA